MLFSIVSLKYYEFCFEVNGFYEQFCIFSSYFVELHLTFLVIERGGLYNCYRLVVDFNWQV